VVDRLPPRLAARLLLPFQRPHQELLFGGKLLNLFVTVLQLLLTLSHLVHQLHVLRPETTQLRDPVNTALIPLL
jgi:hypothetical protein